MKTTTTLDLRARLIYLIQELGLYLPTQNLGVEIIWVSSAKMRQLNNSFRKKDEPTDILSFPLYSSGELQQIDLKSVNPIPLGSLILCRSVISNRAREEGVSIQERISQTIDHGLKHLLGFDHSDDGSRWFPA